MVSMVFPVKALDIESLSMCRQEVGLLLTTVEF